MTKDKILTIIAFISIYFIWGSTYLCVAIAVDEIPPFLMAGVRFVIAAVLIVGLYYLFEKGPRPSQKQLLNSFLAGIMFLALGNGGMTWVLQYLDSGLTAMIVSAQPLVLVLMMWFLDKKPLPLMTFVGIFLGILGMYFLISQDQIVQSDNQSLGIVIILFTIFIWGVASIFVSKVELPKSLMLNSGIQMITGGLFLILASVLVENPFDVNWFDLKSKTWFSLWYLIIFGSIVAFSSFNYLLRTVSPEKVSTSTYINPIVALILGYYFRNEIITNQSIIASLILLTGVYFINVNKKKI